MSDAQSDPSDGSLPKLYTDLLWNIAASARIMRLKFPYVATATADPRLAAIVGEALASTIRHGEDVQVLVSNLGGPARVHAAELETLLGTAAQRIPSWQQDTTRDLAIADLIRTILHLALPSCELAIQLAPALGYDQHLDRLQTVRNGITDLETKLQALIPSLVSLATGAPSRAGRA